MRISYPRKCRSYRDADDYIGSDPHDHDCIVIVLVVHENRRYSINEPKEA